MGDNLKEELIQVMLRLKRIRPHVPGNDLRLLEFFIMHGIEKTNTVSKKNIGVSDIQKRLDISRPAVSQILNALEKKGYVSRRIDKDDRRKITVTLTEEGQKLLKESRRHADLAFETAISRFGEDKTRKFIEIASEFLNVFEECTQSEQRGETLLD